jgi:hypothetical protein
MKSPSFQPLDFVVDSLPHLKRFKPPLSAPFAATREPDVHPTQQSQFSQRTQPLKEPAPQVPRHSSKLKPQTRPLA